MQAKSRPKTEVRLKTPAGAGPDGAESIQRLCRGHDRLPFRHGSPANQMGRANQKAAVPSPLWPTGSSPQKGRPIKPICDRCRWRFWAGLSCISTRQRCFTAKKGLHRADGPDGARHRGRPPLLYKGCPATALKRKGEKAHSPRRHRPPSPNAYSPLQAPSAGWFGRQSSLRFVPLSSFGRKRPATRIKSKPSLLIKKGDREEKQSFVSGEKQLVKNLSKSAVSKIRRKNPPHLLPISLSFTTLYIFFTETLVIRQSIHFFFFFCCANM